MLTRRALTTALRACGLERGGTVLLHVAYSTLEPVEDGPEAVLDVLLDVLGPDGTLLVPTFTLSFCSTGAIDLRNDPETGIIPTFACRDARFRRIVHPIYSFAVAGRLAPVLSRIRSFSAAGADSVFALLADVGAWQCNLGVGWDRGGTYLHHVEEMEGAPYRFKKDFAGTMLTPTGAPARGSWSLYVRDWDRGVIACLPELGRVMDARGWVFHARAGEAVCFGAPLYMVRKVTQTIIRRGEAEGKLYRIGTPEEARAA